MPDAAAPSDATGTRTAADTLALDRRLVRGVAWNAGTKWVAQALTWVSWLIVARLLTPEDYGLVGMATIYLGLITLVSEFGLGTAVLAIRELSDEQIRQLNGLAVVLGLGALVASCAVAVPLGRFFRAPDLPLVVVVMSVTFVITSFKTVPLALLQRELRFETLAWIDLWQTVVLAGSMVGFAAAGFRYWTLVWGAVLGALVSTGALLRLRRVRLALPRRSALGRAMDLSADVVIGRLCWYASAKADALVAGRVLGTVPLGLYNVGWTLAAIPVDRVAALVGQVTPAFFSAVQQDAAALRRYVLRITEGLALVTFPISLGLALVAPDFVLVVLGPRWEGAIGPLRLLAAYAAFRSILPLLPQVLMILRDARFEMWRMVVAAVVMPICFYLAARRWGVSGLAMAWVLVDPLLAIPLYRRVLSRIGLSARAYIGALWPALSGTALMAVGVVSVGTIGANTWSAGVRLTAQVVAGVLSYGLACLVLHRNRFTGLVDLVKAPRPALEGSG